MAAPCRSLCRIRALFKLQHSYNLLLPGDKQNFARQISMTASLLRTADNGNEISPLSQNSTDSTKQISKAMKAYLERAQKHIDFMESELAEYEIGKRHLANIMGADPDNFTQDDIDRAVEYLLPSGLYDKKARPMVKHPYDVIPKRKAAQFGMDGRPFNFLFYTMRPNYYNVLHECALKIEDLKVHEDKMFKRGVRRVQQKDYVQLAGSEWVKQNVLEDKLYEKISEPDYLRFIKIMDRLSRMPYSVLERDYIMQYRVELKVSAAQDTIPALTVDEGSTRAYADATAKRKSCIAYVRVQDKGSGRVVVNGKPFVEFFPNIMDREQILYPLQFTNLILDVDLEATVENGGPSGQAGAIRLATAKALQSFVSPEMREQMRLGGLLTPDPRRRERKKPGQKKARKKFTWKKR